MRYLVLFYFFYIPVVSYSQIQPLSRNDSALAQKYLTGYQSEFDQGDLKEASRYLNDIAFLYWGHNYNEEAIDYYTQSLKLNENLGNENGMAMIHNNLGMLYSDVEDYEKSLYHFNKTLAARRSTNESYGIISALINRSVVLNNLGQYEESAEGLEEALSISRKMNDLPQMRSCYGMLSETYEKAGNVEESLKYYRLYQTFHELMQKGEIEKLQTEIEEEKFLKSVVEAKSKIKDEELAERQYELQKIENELSAFDSLNRKLYENLTKSQLQLELVNQKAEIDRLKAEEARNRNLAIIEKERTFRNTVLIVAISMVAVLFFMIRNFLQVRKSQKALAEKNIKIEGQNSELEKLNQIIQKQNERMQYELNVGREIQLGMVPTHFHLFKEEKAFDIYAMLEPAREVGGDLYDFFKMDDKHLCFCIGDVSDKGVPAALLMAVTKTLIKASAKYNQAPQAILTHVNSEICLENESSMFVTFFLCVLNTETGELRFCNAGHNPPIIRNSSGDLELLKEIHGPVLGALDGISYKQGMIQLNPGDQILLYTDGVTEAMNVDNQLYSEKRLLELVKKKKQESSKSFVESILSSVSLFRGEAYQSDDITILSVRYN